MEWINFIYVIFALIMLFFGAEITLKYSEKVGLALGLSPLVIGLTLVGFGTSLPEFFVSQISAYSGKYEMAIGNIIGSNIGNVLLILGLCAFFRELHLDGRSMRIQTYWHMAVSLLLIAVINTGSMNFLKGSIFLCFFVGYMFNTFLEMKKEKSEALLKLDPSEKNHINDVQRIKMVFLLFLAMGFALLYAGGELLVFSGSNLARSMGISEFAISAILLGLGTSCPELFTALIAVKDKKDISLITGNIIGSNIFNIAFIVGSLAPYQFSFAQAYNLESITIFSISVFFIVCAHMKLKMSWPFTIICSVTYLYLVRQWV